jgi:hypothetical protein
LQVNLADAAGPEERSAFKPPWFMSDLHHSQRKTVSDKALTISRADRFTRRGGICPTTRDIDKPTCC